METINKTNEITKIIKTKPFSIIGGKHAISKYLLQIVDIYNYDYYIEPYIGSGTLFFYNSCLSHRSKTKIIINDFNNAIYNFYKVLRDKSSELIQSIKFTQYSRKTFQEAVENFGNQNLTDIERARHFYMFVRGKLPATAMHKKKQTLKLGILNKEFHSFYTKLDKFDIFHEYLKNTLIENMDAIDLLAYWLKTIIPTDKVLIYLDPPYLASVCKTKDIYNKSLSDNDIYHKRLLDLINRYRSSKNVHILLSGYNSDLYKAELTRWYKKIYKIPVPTSGNKVGAKHRYAEEYLWGNVEWHRYYKNCDDGVYEYIMKHKFDGFTIAELLYKIRFKKRFLVKKSGDLKDILDRLVNQDKLFIDTREVICNKVEGYRRKVIVYRIKETLNIMKETN